MSFGRPPTFSDFRPVPPDRGAFPLDHDGECQQRMQEYLDCLKKNNSQSKVCRPLAKTYLECRMERGLMAVDDFANLGFEGASNKQCPAEQKDKVSGA